MRKNNRQCMLCNFLFNKDVSDKYVQTEDIIEAETYIQKENIIDIDGIYNNDDLDIKNKWWLFIYNNV